MNRNKISKESAGIMITPYNIISQHLETRMEFKWQCLLFKRKQNVICSTNIDPWGPSPNSKHHIEPLKDMPNSILEKHTTLNAEGVQETALS